MITSDDFETHARFGKLPGRLSPKEVEEVKALIEKNQNQNKKRVGSQQNSMRQS